MRDERLISLDALRGFTIMGMIIVNSPGSWSHVYEPLLHASWHGVTPTDLVFPFFLFIVGVSITLSYTKQRERRTPKAHLHAKIGLRALKLFALGLFLNLWPGFDFEELRVAGVLQRIAIVFALCALLFLHTNWRQQLWVGIGLLVGYWALLSWIPVPLDDVNREALQTGQVERSSGTRVDVEVEASGEGALRPNLEPGTNLVAWLDRRLLPGRFWERSWDPEGLGSTLPAVATGIFGMLVGTMLLSIGDPYRRVSWVFFVGMAAVMAGAAWSWAFPLNKNLWSSSFVLHAGGWAALCLGAALLLLDVLRYRSWAKVGVIFGANPLVAYALSGVLIVVFYSGFAGFPSLSVAFMDSATAAGIPAKLASLSYAILYLGVLFLPVWWLWKRRIYIRL